MENIICKKDRIALCAEYEDPQLHRHFSKHIIVSDRPFLCFVENREYPVRSMVIQSQVVHSVKKDSNSRMIVFLIDETSELSGRIDRKWLKGNAQNPLNREIETSVINRIKAGYSLSEIDEYIMKQLHSDDEKQPDMDDRISAALRYIEESESLNQEIYNELSEKMNLSKSRFLHLFKDEMGIDLKNYLLLKRLEKVYKSVTETHMSITDAAILAGFSSSSHFSEACKRHYGISLTDFLKAQKIEER